ncbi:hypothetical protein L2E82_10204 [Cichorium intybus]|uniref:Uncharacterized protein n=1 Tax=Cichorium intybus TaxID=13427 RepID=A0ACB9G9T3_CICIN|nr:hypothetical protein L2E82_10204 [Cichorium intybus]
MIVTENTPTHISFFDDRGAAATLLGDGVAPTGDTIEAISSPRDELRYCHSSPISVSRAEANDERDRYELDIVVGIAGEDSNLSYRWFHWSNLLRAYVEATSNVFPFSSLTEIQGNSVSAMKLPGHDDDISSENGSGALLKWMVEFGKELENCVILGATGFQKGN